MYPRCHHTHGSIYRPRKLRNVPRRACMAPTCSAWLGPITRTFPPPSSTRWLPPTSPSQDPPAAPTSLAQLPFDRLVSCAVAYYAFAVLTAVPYALCSIVVRYLLPSATSSTSAPHQGPAAAHPPAPAAAQLIRQQQHLLDVYDMYLHFLLYDMACVVHATWCTFHMTAQERRMALAPDPLVSLAEAMTAAMHARIAPRSSPQPASPAPPPVAQTQPPDDTWQALARAQAAAAQREAMAAALGVWGSRLTEPRPGRAGSATVRCSGGTISSQVVLDSTGLQLGGGLDPGVAGQVLSCLLLARRAGPRDVATMRVVARGGETALLLVVALHHGPPTGLCNLVFAPQLLLPHEGHQVRGASVDSDCWRVGQARTLIAF